MLASEECMQTGVQEDAYLCSIVNGVLFAVVQNCWVTEKLLAAILDFDRD